MEAGLGEELGLKPMKIHSLEIHLQNLTKSISVLGLSAVSHFAQDFPGYLLNKIQCLGLHLKTEATENLGIIPGSPTFHGKLRGAQNNFCVD